MSNNPQRDEIIRRLDLEAEFQKAGGRIPPGARPNADGWLPVHSIDREDKHPSAALNVGSDPKKRGIYVDQAATGIGAKSFFDLMAVMPGPFMSGNEVYNHFARETGMSHGEGRKADHPAPTLTDVEGFQKNLTSEIKSFLREKRGLDEESLVKYRVGWCIKQERNAFPVFDETGSLRNIRFHNSKKRPKTLSWTGFGEARLWGLERLAKAVPGTKILITEGECFPEDAEILTPHGWIPFPQYNGELVAQVKDGGAADFVMPTAFIKKAFKGQLIKNHSRFFTSITTPRHKMVSVNPSGKWVKHEADRSMPVSYKLPRVTWIDGPGISLNEYQLMLAIAVSADATIDKRKNSGYNGKFAKEDRYARFGFKKGRKISRLRTILDGLGIQYSDNEISNDTRSICFPLPDWVPGRILPFEWIQQASLDQRLFILGEILHWDGNSVLDRDQIEFSTTIKENADFIQSMAHTSGMCSTIISRNHGQYSWLKVSILHNKRFNTWQSIKTNRVDYEGDVYCVQVPTGMILVRQEDKIYITGNCDAMLAEQETGLVAVSATNGVRAFKPEWTNHFHGFHIVLVYDCDAEGREAVHNLVLPAFQEAVESGRVLSIKVIWLYDNSDKNHKDFTDFVTKDGGSGDALKKLIQETAPYVYAAAGGGELQAPIELASFTQIDQSEFAGQRVTVNLQVFGENTVAYHAATKIQVTNCPLLKGGTCNGPKGREGSCKSDRGGVIIPTGHRVQIAGVRATDGQLMNHLRAFVCDKDKRPTLEVKDHDKITIREVYGHQVVGAMPAERIELVEKPVYVIGGDLVEIGNYQATGRVITSYRDQQPTMLIDTMQRMEEDYQGFSIEKYRPSLEKLQRMSPKEIADDLAVHITRIYERPDLHLGVLLVLCSPLGFEFPGEGQIRGWLTAIIVGDTGTGKTTVSEGFFNFAQIGSRVSGMTASRTGITYGCEHDERRGWRIKAGALLKMNRQALIVDEAQDVPQEELKTMAEGIDTGLLRIDKIQHKIFESRTRVLFGCNPKHPKQASEQRTMDSFRYGCEAIKGIFPQMMIRRIDFAMFAATWDIEDKKKIFFPEVPDTPQQVTAEDLRALIFFAWNLKPEQIVIDRGTAQYIREIAKYLSDKFGGSDDLPIVYSEDFRKSMARLSVAYATIDLATDDDFSQVVVNPGHVADACELLERIYEARNCKLNKYAKHYRLTHGIEGIEKIVEEIDSKLADTSDARRRFHHIMYELLNCPDGARVRKTDLADEFGVDPKTIQIDMQFFRENHLIDSNVQKGYRPEPRFFQVYDYLERLNSAKYCFDLPWKKAYPR